MSEENKKLETKDLVLAVLCYLAILILIPIFMVKDEKFVRFHIKQGFPLFIADLALSVIGVALGWIPVVGAILGWVCGALGLVLLVLSILGIVNAVQGKEAELPLVGQVIAHIKK